jgi:tetratricopeptide (TPR) repeat protein
LISGLDSDFRKTELICPTGAICRACSLHAVIGWDKREAFAPGATGPRERAPDDKVLDRNLVAPLQMQRGYALRTARQYGEAIAAFDRTIDINSSWPLAYFGRAASFDDRGDPERAAAEIRSTAAMANAS